MIRNRSHIMALDYTVVFLLVVCCLPCRVEGIEYNFTVSVPTDAKPGTAFVSVLSLLGRAEKAELPCAIVDRGDPYGRFNVSTDCTVVVARPLDWSVKSEYLLKIRVGQLQDPDNFVVRLKVNVTQVLGYPPVYNETCETPIRSAPPGKEFLLGLGMNVEVVHVTGDVVSGSMALTELRPVWNMSDPIFMILTESDRCQVHIVFGARGPNDLAIAAELVDSNYNGTVTPVTMSCQPLSDMVPDLSVLLFTTRGSRNNLRQLEQLVPDVMSTLHNPPFVYLITYLYQTKDKNRYNCEVPSWRRPIYFSTRPDSVGVTHITTLTVEILPIGCPPGTFGYLCEKTCICENGARCHGFNGACKCTDGWQGVACDIPKPGVSATTTPSDPSDIYISADVTVHCHAHHLDVTTLSLLLPNGSVTVSYGVSLMNKTIFNIQPDDGGAYTCQVGDTNGRFFNATVVLDIINCPPSLKGELCDEPCDCLHGASCDRLAGCVCPPGWTGTRCQAPCPDGTYGKDCGKICRCLNGANCSPSDGACTCMDGWYGLNCDVPCPKYRYGMRCQQVCTCKNEATCNNVDGSCECVSPWTGRNCDETQPGSEPLLVETLAPLGSLVVLVVVVATILYKNRHLFGDVPDADGEAEALLGIEQVETDLAQTVRPGWLSRWEKTSQHLTLGDLVGMGMFGHVIQGTLHTAGGEIIGVAAKSVRRKDPQCYRNFYKEAAILVTVHENEHHNNLRSNIIRFFGLINEPSQKYLLLEYASKGSLLSLLRFGKKQDGAASLPHSILYAVHIARALQELQRLAITHWDVAARNVLITADDVAKLADFGRARDVYTAAQDVDADEREDLEDNEVVPMNWMSPESLETGQYTCQSDVWSFGVLLWEIATLGQEPHYDGNNSPSCRRLARALRRGIRLRRPPECSGEMYDVMMSCWQEHPWERSGPDEVEGRLLRLNSALEMETVV